MIFAETSPGYLFAAVLLIVLVIGIALRSRTPPRDEQDGESHG